MSEHNYNPQSLPGGTYTSGNEIHRAGGNQWADPHANEAAVQNLRNNEALAHSALMDRLGHDSGPRYKAKPLTATQKLNISKSILGLVGFSGIVLFASLYYEQSRVSFRDAISVFNKNAYPMPKAHLDYSRNSNWKEYQSLFRENAPMDVFYSGCAVKNCHTGDVAAFRKFASYTKSPQTYESDVCSMMIKTYEGFAFASHLPKPVWKLGTSRSDYKTHGCYLVNQNEMWKAVNGFNTGKKNMAIASAVISTSLLIFILIRFPRKRVTDLPVAKA
ncbi:hypothetical protein [Polaromonas sp. YR568]|uniref:hypothetical protein n=1 Tax=Polaromonas sp. YR568 TaxID=1855301 RepID=UPI0031381528